VEEAKATLMPIAPSTSPREGAGVMRLDRHDRDGGLANCPSGQLKRTGRT